MALRIYHRLIGCGDKDNTVYYIRATLTDNSGNFPEAKISPTFTKGTGTTDLFSAITNNSVEFSYTKKYLKSIYGLFNGIRGITTNTSSQINGKVYSVEFTEKLDNVENAAHLFSQCTALVSVDFNNAVLNKVTNAESMFNNCNSLTSISNSGALSINMGSITNANKMFQGCKNIVSITDFNNCLFQNVTDTSEMFSNCEKLETLNLNSATFESVGDSSYMFHRNLVLKNLNLSSATFENVTNSSYMFNNFKHYNNNGLSLPSATFEKVTNASNMFKNAEIRLLSDSTTTTTLSIPLATFDKVTNANNMFNNFWGSLNISSATFNSATTASYMFYSMMAWVNNGGSIADLSLNSATFKNVTNASYMFYKCRANTTANALSFGELQDGSYMFTGSKIGINNTQNLDLRNIKFDKVTNARSMFGAEDAYLQKTPYGWVQLNNNPVSSDRIILTAATFESVTNAGYMFAGANGELDLSSAKFKNITDARYMIACYSGTTINMSNNNSTFENVTNCSSMFEGCTQLTTLVVPHTAKFPKSLNLMFSPLSETSIEHISYWIKDLTNLTQQTLTLRQSAWDAVQNKTTIEARIRGKNWDLQFDSSYP